jgi:sigma-E factor negative regulatory protein RseA
MKEQLSALMDSELSAAEAARLMKAMKNDDALQEAWTTYHLLGDALRKSPQLSADFNAKLMQRLAQEPTVLAPQREHKRLAATQRFPLSIAASVAAVGLVSILALQITRLNQGAVPTQVAVAAVPQQVAMLTPAQPKADEKALERTPAHVKFTSATPSTYLLAHQEFSPSYTPAYVRVVSEQRDGKQ